MQLGSVKSLFRYPVKSLRGTACDQLEFDTRGAYLDRLYSVMTADGKLGSHKSTPWFRALPGLFDLQAEVVGEQVQVLLPDGRCLLSDDPVLASAISEIVGQPVSLAKETDQSHFDDGATHLLTTSSLQWLKDRLPDSKVDPRRFRPNIVIDSMDPGLTEQNWIGRAIRVGQCELEVIYETERCIMTTLAQGDLPADPAIARTINQHAGSSFGVYATVRQPGSVRVDDPVTFVG